MLYVKHFAQCLASSRYSAVNGMDGGYHGSSPLAHFEPGPENPVGFWVLGCYLRGGGSE